MNIQKELKNRIEEVLPKKKDVYDWTKDEHYKTCKDGCTYCCNAKGFETGYNQYRDNIDPDRLIKVVVEYVKCEIEKIETFEPEDDFEDGGDMEYASRRLAVDNSRRWGETKIKSDILQLLNNLTKDEKSN